MTSSIGKLGIMARISCICGNKKVSKLRIMLFSLWSFWSPC